MAVRRFSLRSSTTIDLSLSSFKFAAGREKDFRFIRALLSRKLIKLTSVRRFIGGIEDPVFQKLMADRLTKVASAIPDKSASTDGRHQPSKPLTTALCRFARIWIDRPAGILGTGTRRLRPQCEKTAFWKFCVSIRPTQEISSISNRAWYFVYDPDDTIATKGSAKTFHQSAF